MNVKLAAQMLSDSVADALEFCEIVECPGFEGCGATVKFIRTFNKLFDILNSRNVLSSGFKKPISKYNCEVVFKVLKEIAEYIKSLACPVTGKLILKPIGKLVFCFFY